VGRKRPEHNGRSTVRLEALASVRASGGAAGQPYTGKVAFGDRNGDPLLDVVVCTSYWVPDFQASWNFAATGVASYAMNLTGDGSPKGIVYWLHQSN
jgi:hypothetical protein